MSALGPLPSGLSAVDTYSVRMMLGLAASLSIVLVLTNLPLYQPTDQVGWSPNSSDPPPERIALSEVRTTVPREDALLGTETAPLSFSQSQRATQSNSPPKQSPSQRKPTTSNSASSRTGDSTSASQSDPHLVSALGPNDRKPEIVGGMGALYHNIQYPEEARDQGIEGLLRLEFTVQADGKVRNVEVVDSLHPLCDSAAVEGIRSVRFVPAEHRGTAVPARMRLPVRFRLISVPKTADANS